MKKRRWIYFVGVYLIMLLASSAVRWSRTESQKRYFFGCCSLTSQDAGEGGQTMRRIEKDDAMHPKFFVSPQKDYVCEAENISGENEDYQLPKLFLNYLHFGAKVCSAPAIDCEFKTTDFFVMFDFEKIAQKTRRMFLV